MSLAWHVTVKSVAGSPRALFLRKMLSEMRAHRLGPVGAHMLTHIIRVEGSLDLAYGDRLSLQCRSRNHSRHPSTESRELIQRPCILDSDRGPSLFSRCSYRRGAVDQTATRTPMFLEFLISDPFTKCRVPQVRVVIQVNPSRLTQVISRNHCNSTSGCKTS